MPKYRADSETDFDDLEDLQVQCKVIHCELCRAARADRRDEATGKATGDLTSDGG